MSRGSHQACVGKGVGGLFRVVKWKWLSQMFSSRDENVLNMSMFVYHSLFRTVLESSNLTTQNMPFSRKRCVCYPDLEEGAGSRTPSQSIGRPSLVAPALPWTWARLWVSDDGASVLGLTSHETPEVWLWYTNHKVRGQYTPSVCIMSWCPAFVLLVNFVIFYAYTCKNT